MTNIYETNHVGELTKKWSDKPLYGNKDDTYQKTNDDFYKRRFNKSAESPSNLLLWFLEESKKRDKGLINEIDINEIKAAIMGVRNKWFITIKKHRDEFIKLIESKKINWLRIMELKNDRIDTSLSADC